MSKAKGFIAGSTVYSVHKPKLVKPDQSLDWDHTHTILYYGTCEDHCCQ